MATYNIGHLWKNAVPNPLGTTQSVFPLLDLGNNANMTLGSTGDIYNIITIPKRIQSGADWKIWMGDHDTGAGLVVTLRLWDGATAFPLIHQSSVGQGGGVAVPSKGPATETGIGKITDDRDWSLQLLIDTQAGSAQAGRIWVQCHLNGWYPRGIISE